MSEISGIRQDIWYPAPTGYPAGNPESGFQNCRISSEPDIRQNCYPVHPYLKIQPQTLEVKFDLLGLTLPIIVLFVLMNVFVLVISSPNHTYKNIHVCNKLHTHVTQSQTHMLTLPVPGQRLLCVARMGGGYIVPPLNISAPGRASGLI